MRGSAIPGWCGSSARCGGKWLLQPSRTLRTSHSPSWSRGWKSDCSSTQNVYDLHERAGSKRFVHMHGELFKSRCDTCSRPPFRDTNAYEPPAELPRCGCGGGIRPHICWFGEVPFELYRIFQALDECSIFMAVGTSGVVEPAASFVAQVRGRARTIYLGAEEPANALAFTECHLGKAGEVLPLLTDSTQWN
jgi:NAD-dependent protein deacetylase/lipoamidase